MGYSRDELFGLWQGFRGQSNEVQMLMDFALCDQQEARALIDDFETKLECSILDGSHRGKEHRGEVEYCVANKRRGRPKSMIRQQFPDIADLVDNPPPTGPTATNNPIIDRKTAEKIIEEARNRAEIK